jgi:hypothetical protein
LCPNQDFLQASKKCLPKALIGYDMQHRPQNFQQYRQSAGTGITTTDLEKMSEQSFRPISNWQAGTKLESLYKPVGIAALAAAALCMNAGADKKK